MIVGTVTTLYTVCVAERQDIRPQLVKEMSGCSEIPLLHVNVTYKWEPVNGLC